MGHNVVIHDSMHIHINGEYCIKFSKKQKDDYSGHRQKR